jgi:hypothetical protein
LQAEIAAMRDFAWREDLMLVDEGVKGVARMQLLRAFPGRTHWRPSDYRAFLERFPMDDADLPVVRHVIQMTAARFADRSLVGSPS